MVTGLHSFKGLQSIFSPLMTKSLAISPSMDDYAMLAKKTQAGIFSEFMVCSVGVLCMLPYLQTRKHGNVMCLNKEDPRWLQSCSIYEGTGISVWHCAPFLDLSCWGFWTVPQCSKRRLPPPSTYSRFLPLCLYSGVHADHLGGTFFSTFAPTIYLHF